MKLRSTPDPRCWLLALLAWTTAIAQGPAPTAPEMQAMRLDAAPQLDGRVLGDDAWSGTVPGSGFWQIQPDDGDPATQKTEVHVGFTDTALYIAVVAYDDSAEGILVTDSRRDSSLDDTDAFLLVIDGLLDRQNGFVFGTNPAGIEYDGQVIKEGGGGQFASGGGGFNLNWDGAWTVRTATGEFGWSAEFEIPFRTLRYGSGDVQDWGINFQRNIRRNNEIAFWAPLGRNRNLYRVSEAGTLKGVAPPKQRNLTLTPYVLGKARRGGELTGTETDAEAGIDLKYSVTPSLTLDLTYNTDFAQVEADEVQINLDRFNLFFPEKRPFFLENAGLFAFGNAQEVELFFSRRIGISDAGELIPVEGGARLSGKVGESTNVGLLYMGTDGVDGVVDGDRFAVFRVSQELGKRSAIGAIAVGRDAELDGDDHRSYGIDGRLGIGDHLILESWLARTDTPGRDGKDHAFAVKAGYSSEKWSSNLSYTEVREDFNPEVGFLERSEYRKVSALLLRRIRPRDLWGLLEVRPHVSYTGYRKFDGFRESGFLHIDNHFEFRSGAEFHTGVNVTHAGVLEAFEIVDGVFVQPGSYDHAELQLVYRTNRSKPLSFSARAMAGGRFGGDRISLSPEIRYRVGETFRAALTVFYNDFDLPVPGGDFTANLARLRLSYSFTPKVQLQALIQHDDASDVLGTNLRFSWLQSANSGLYVVYNEVDERGIGALPAGRELIVKYSRILDLLDGRKARRLGFEPIRSGFEQPPH